MGRSQAIRLFGTHVVSFTLGPFVLSPSCGTGNGKLFDVELAHFVEDEIVLSFA